jgi:hypothetical protein
LSYILHGHIPYYSGGHRDSILDRKLRELPDLLSITPETWAHFSSDMRYATHALPINVLLDTLVRQDADTEVNPISCLKWNYEPESKVSHVILGSADTPGGVWVHDPESPFDSIGTLSYAEMLSLPGYSFSDHYLRVHGRHIPELDRPSRSEVAAYYAAYPKAVGIADCIRMGSPVKSIRRQRNGFMLQPVNVFSKSLVLATGIFDHSISPPYPISLMTKCNAEDQPLLVIGSGYSAADAIISYPGSRKIIHIYRWDPVNKPSPLKGCHHSAYPEYAGVYRQMKAAASRNVCSSAASSPGLRKKGNPFLRQRDWSSIYEGFANASIEDVQTIGTIAQATIRLEDGGVEERLVGGLQYMVGRRGSLDYLDPSLRSEVLSGTPSKSGGLISSRTLRAKAELDMEVAPSVFIIGSLTGDSLVRHAFGSCVYAGGKILRGTCSQGVPDGLNGVKENWQVRTQDLESTNR